jgi:PiT family inorganic phosphate transporter
MQRKYFLIPFEGPKQGLKGYGFFLNISGRTRIEGSGLLRVNRVPGHGDCPAIYCDFLRRATACGASYLVTKCDLSDYSLEDDSPPNIRPPSNLRLHTVRKASGEDAVLNHLDPASALAVGLLIFALVMVIMFEATNGFHDAANAVATVIYTKSLGAGHAVVLSGVMNFVGVMVGGIAVAYALVELLPAEVLSPPDGGPAVAMLVSLFVAALLWNIGTWWFGLPNSSSHCLIGALIGVALGNAFARSRSIAEGVHWAQLWKVLEALAFSPIMGFVLAGALYLLCRKTLHDQHLYEPVKDKPPVWWMRGILIATCSGVSFAHGTNDGQKSIGLIMLTIIGIFPATYALNPGAKTSLQDLSAIMQQAEAVTLTYGDDRKATAMAAAKSIESRAQRHQAGTDGPTSEDPTAGQHKLEVGPDSTTAQARASVRDDVYQVISELKHAEEVKGISAEDKKKAQQLAKQLGQAVEYAPFWVRMLSAICLGVGTMIGYKRIVKTLGERLGNVHLTPAQGAAAELISAVLIGTAGFTGLPVSTTHIVTAGIAGTMVTSGAGLKYGMISRILIAWGFTLPVTIVVAGGLYYLLTSPRF